jgi:hypothetical protein
VDPDTATDGKAITNTATSKIGTISFRNLFLSIYFLLSLIVIKKNPQHQIAKQRPTLAFLG